MADKGKAVDALRCMGGMADNQAARYAENCTDNELELLAACEDGRQYSEAINLITDRLAKA